MNEILRVENLSKSFGRKQVLRDLSLSLEKGKVYKLTIDLFSTALVFNKGHRIAVHIAGSNAPRYEVHPNSFELVNSYDNAPVAHNTVHVSAEHASRLILPVIAPGVSKDYAPQEQLGHEGME